MFNRPVGRTTTTPDFVVRAAKSPKARSSLGRAAVGRDERQNSSFLARRPAIQTELRDIFQFYSEKEVSN
jgi:hypothetical protein